METEILRKFQPHNYDNWQATTESHLGGDWQETRGILNGVSYYFCHFARQ